MSEQPAGPTSEEDIDVVRYSQDTSQGLWVADDDETNCFGVGVSQHDALGDYLEHVRELYERLLELGPENVSTRLWSEMPALRKVLGMSGDY